jgi:hypothetical protein
VAESAQGLISLIVCAGSSEYMGGDLLPMKRGALAWGSWDTLKYGAMAKPPWGGWGVRTAW